MEDEHKNKKQLLRDLTKLRSQNGALEESSFGNMSADLTMDEVTHCYAQSILETLRDPILVLDEDLKIMSANRSFYTTFQTIPEETIGSFIYDLKNKDWDIPKLRELLEKVIAKKQAFDDFEISHDFQDIGHKVMLLNAREIYRKDMGATVILLAFEDITEHKRLEDLLADSEERYRRLFETANDGIVLLEKDQGKITHVNPAFEKMLGYNTKEVIDNKLQNFVVLPDLHDFQTIMQVLIKEGIIKFDDVPVTTKFKQYLDTEMYLVDRAKLVQCNIRDVTERKRQEEAQRKSEKKFRTIFNSSSDAIFIHDSSGRFLEVNNVACERLGYTRDELLEKTLMDIDAPEAARIAPERIRQLHQEGFISFEAVHQGKDGQQFPVEITSRLIDYEGETWILSTARDITKRKQAEKELHRYQHLLDKSQEIAHLGSWEVDVPSGRFTWSDETYRIFGLEPQETEITYKTFLQFIHPEDRDAVDSAYMDSIRMNKDTHEVEHRIIRDRDGSIRTVFEKCYYIRDDSGNIVRSVGMVQDVTEQKQREREIKAREEELQLIFNTVESGIVLVDKNGCIIQTNTTMTEMLRYNHADIIGSKYMDYVYESETEAADTKMRQLMNHELDSAHLERRYQRSDGTIFWGSLSGRRLYYPDGTFGGLVGAIIDITERKQAEERIYYLAYYDELTDLPNRRLFHERLKQITAQCEHLGAGGVVFLVDMTRLRAVNDTLGQQAGNELIRKVARRIVDTVGAEDTVARVAGGEFMVLSEGRVTDERAYNLGVRILERIGRELELSGRFVYPEVNIGFTLFPDRGTDPDTLIKQADLALSEAKKRAHRIQEYAGQEDWISRQFHLEHDLKKGLTNEEFFLCYQSQIDLRTGRIVGLEALLRWMHPQRGAITPGEFIPVLEYTGMIAAADEWVIRRVCKQLGSWQQRGIYMKAAVNLSAQELNNDAIIEVVRTALNENKLQAGSLEVEITETDLMENIERTSRILQLFSSWGVGVALDDFGTGYSSLSYLQRLPINTIKIDKEFVFSLPENEDSVTLVQTIIDMAHNMGKEVLAEGVEREEQRQKLCEMGCDYGQGFLWSRPLPVENLSFIGG